MIKAQTLKGFRDFLPADAIKRQFVIGKIKEVFERFGFDPLETPALEYAQTLLGKYGEEADKLLYLFEDNGKRKVGLRYDQTVPLARVVSQYPDLPKPFKRYQIQPVWRAENTQKGRFREFLQCDIDTIGTDSALADTEIIDCTLTAYKELGFTGLTMIMNDRTIFDRLNLTKKEIIIIDKLAKIGEDAVLRELGRKDILVALKNAPPTPQLKMIFNALKELGYKENVDFRFDPFLARGLDYYTSTIFELKTEKYSGGSLAGGGRYDNLIGQFTGKSEPAVGIAFGFDRTMEAMDSLQLLPTHSTTAQVLVTVFSKELLSSSLAIVSKLRNEGMNTDIAETEAKLDRQLKYADRKGIPYVVIQGPNELQKNIVMLKNMKTKEQKELTIDALLDILKSN